MMKTEGRNPLIMKERIEMYAMIENGIIVRTKAEAIARAKDLLDEYIANGCNPDYQVVNVLRANANPKTVWFRVGYGECDDTDYVQIGCGYRTSEQIARLNALRKKLGIIGE